jgi:hypothetical protein
MRLPLTVAAAAALILQCAQAGTEDHTYKKGEHVELWVNKVRRMTIRGSRMAVIALPSQRTTALREVHTVRLSLFILFIYFYSFLPKTTRSDRMQTPKKLMNITHFRIAHRTHNIIPILPVVVSTNGRFRTLGNTWGDMPFAIRATIFPSCKWLRLKNAPPKP